MLLTNISNKKHSLCNNPKEKYEQSSQNKSFLTCDLWATIFDGHESLFLSKTCQTQQIANRCK